MHIQKIRNSQITNLDKKVILLSFLRRNGRGKEFLTNIKKESRLLQILLNMAGTTRLELATWRLLGHENQTTTEIYLHSINESERKAIKVFDELAKKSHTNPHTSAE